MKPCSAMPWPPGKERANCRSWSAKIPSSHSISRKARFAACFNPKYYLRHLDQDLRRVFGAETRHHAEEEGNDERDAIGYLVRCSGLMCVILGSYAVLRQPIATSC